LDRESWKTFNTSGKRRSRFIIAAKATKVVFFFLRKNESMNLGTKVLKALLSARAKPNSKTKTSRQLSRASPTVSDPVFT